MQQEALNTVIQRNLNVRQTETLVTQIMSEDGYAKKKRKPLSHHDKDMLTRFQDKLGTKIEMTRSDTDDSGRLVIHFYSEEELQAIFDAILKDDKRL